MGKQNFRSQLRVFRILLTIIALVILSVIGIIIFCSIEETVKGRGVVVGKREYQLKSSVQSRIRKIYFHSGDTVKAGDLLLELEDRPLRSEIELLSNAIAELEAEIVVKTWSLEILKHDPLPAEYRHTSITLEESRARVRKSEYELKTFKELYEKDVVAQLEYEKKEMEHIANITALQKLEEDFAKLQAGFADKIISQAENELELLKVRLQGRKNELAIKEAEREEYCFYAPEDGTISYIPTKRGTFVSPGDVLVEFSATGQKKFIAYIDEQQIHKITEGQPARIASTQYNYFDYGYYEGSVYLIEELPEVIGGRTCYRVRILIENEPQPLRLGSTGEAEIITGDSRILLYLTGLNH